MAASKSNATKSAQANKDVAETKDQLPAGMADMEQEAGAGFEDAGSESYAIPFLRPLQDLSPQVKKQRSEFVEGASAGMLFNTVTEQVYPADSSEGEEGVLVIPCYFRQAMVEWRPRDEGGGYVAEHPVGAEKGLERDGGKFITSDGNELQDTRYHYVILLNPDGSYEPALMTMTSTQIPTSKRWMSMMQGIKFKNNSGQSFTPPMFSHTYRVRTKPQSNDQGDWYGLDIKKESRLQADDLELYEAAKQFRDAIKAGDVKEQAPNADIPDDASAEF